MKCKYCEDHPEMDKIEETKDRLILECPECGYEDSEEKEST